MNRSPLRTEHGYVYTGLTLSTKELMEMDVKDLEHLKGEVFKQWDRLGAIITLKKDFDVGISIHERRMEMESEEE
tara:strand:- start:170 stop:394 length:225 start_codon:yes stop_codon:yes gene_type:complete